MGAIQNSINSVLGTTAAGLGLGKKLRTDAAELKSAELQELANLKASVPNLQSEIDSLQPQVENEEWKVKYKDFMYQLDKEQGNLLYEPGEEKSVQQLSLEKHAESFNILKNQLEAKQFQNNLWTNRLEELKNKYGGNI